MKRTRPCDHSVCDTDTRRGGWPTPDGQLVFCAKHSGQGGEGVGQSRREAAKNAPKLTLPQGQRSNTARKNALRARRQEALKTLLPLLGGRA